MKNKLSESTYFYRESAFNAFVETLEQEEKEIARSALYEIRSLKKELDIVHQRQNKLISKNKELQKELELVRYHLKEVIVFFGKKTEELAKILKAPVHFEREIHMRHHYFYLRDSIKKLLMDCRSKVKEMAFMGGNEREN